ncbi:MAG: hypothetical protein FRX49_00347 [Trebouxia sp. A1-2]|nr:MAG: hypothetical protein FRX49_00347 [Trebouxia sp. A1-2]
MSSLTVRGVLRKSSQNDKQTSAPGVAAYLLANGEVAVALEALISQGALGDCTEGLPASCAFEGLVITGLGWPCASEPCAQRHLSGETAVTPGEAAFTPLCDSPCLRPSATIPPGKTVGTTDGEGGLTTGESAVTTDGAVTGGEGVSMALVINSASGTAFAAEGAGRFAFWAGAMVKAPASVCKAVTGDSAFEPAFVAGGLSLKGPAVGLEGTSAGSDGTCAGLKGSSAAAEGTSAV